MPQGVYAGSPMHRIYRQNAESIAIPNKDYSSAERDYGMEPWYVSLRLYNFSGKQERMHSIYNELCEAMGRHVAELFAKK